MTCPNCGQEFEGKRCPNCGRPAANAANRVFAILIAIFLVLPCAAFGACSVWTGVTFDPRDSGAPFSLIALSVGGVAIAAFVGLAYLVARLWRG